MFSLKYDNKLNILFIKRYFIIYRGISDIVGVAYEVRWGVSVCGLGDLRF